MQISTLQTEKEVLGIDLVNAESKNNCAKEDLLKLSLIVSPPSAEEQKIIDLLSAPHAGKAKMARSFANTIILSSQNQC